MEILAVIFLLTVYFHHFGRTKKKVPAGHNRHVMAFPPCACLLLTFFQTPDIKSSKQVTLRLMHANKPVFSKLIATPAKYRSILSPLRGTYLVAFSQQALISSASSRQRTAGEGCGSPWCGLSRKDCRRCVLLPAFDPCLCGSGCTALTY